MAVALPQGEDDSAPGKLVFFDTSGAYLEDVTSAAGVAHEVRGSLRVCEIAPAK